MGHDWIIDVLTDLRTFAARNDLALLADQLDRAQRIAAAEMSSRQAVISGYASDDGFTVQEILDGPGERDCA